MTGGGSCEVFDVDRGADALGAAARAAPRQLARPRTTCCASSASSTRSRTRPSASRGPSSRAPTPSVFGAPFYVMERIDGRPILHVRARGVGGRTGDARPGARGARSTRSWRSTPSTGRRAVSATWPTPATIWRASSRAGSTQLDSYGGRDLPAAPRHRRLARRGIVPADQPSALCHGDYKLDNVLFAPDAPPAPAGGRRLGDGGDRRSAGRPGVGADLPSGPGRDHAARHDEGTDVRARAPSRPRPAASSATPCARAATPSAIGWYDVFARWKLAIVLEGSYAKFQRGLVRQADPRVLRVAGRPAARPARPSVIDREDSDGCADARVAGTGRGEPIDVLHQVEIGSAGARARPDPHSGDRGGHRAARRVHVPGHLPAHPAAAVHVRTGGDRHGHRGRRGRRHRDRRTDHVRDRVLDGPRFVRRGVPRRGRLRVPGARRASPMPRRPGSGSRTSPRGSGWSIAAISPRGEWLAVLGAAGGSGIAAVQLGRALGARVIAVVSDEEKAAFCRELGADVAINHRDGPLDPAAARARPAGAASTSSTTPSAVRWPRTRRARSPAHGRLLAVGFASGTWPKIAAHDLVVTNTSLVGVFAGGYVRAELDDIHAHLAALVADGRLRNAVRAEVAVRRAARRAPAHGRPRGGRQAGDGAVKAGLTKPAELDLDAEEIVTAAVEIFEESGLDAVSMRSVSARLGVSPVPLYSRIGNKDALLDAIADRLLADLAPPADAARAVGRLRARAGRGSCASALRRARDSRLILWPGRDAYVEASRPLVDAMRRDGFDADAAVQACRLLMWATVGFGAVESGVEPPARGGGGRGPAAIRAASTPAETEALFDLHIRYLIEGIARRRSRRRSGTAQTEPAMTIPSLDASGKVVIVTGRQQGLGPGHGAGLRGGRRRRGRRQPQARAVRGRCRRDPTPSAGGPWRCAVTSATGTSARRWSTPPSPSSAASTCWSTTPASRRSRPRCSTSPRTCSTRRSRSTSRGRSRLTALAAEHMPTGGSVINISSKASLHPTPFTVVYAAAKAGLNALTKAAAARVRPARHPRQCHRVRHVPHRQPPRVDADRGAAGPDGDERQPRPDRRRGRDRGHRALPRERRLVVPDRRADLARRRLTEPPRRSGEHDDGSNDMTMTDDDVIGPGRVAVVTGAASGIGPRPGRGVRGRGFGSGGRRPRRRRRPRRSRPASARPAATPRRSRSTSPTRPRSSSWRPPRCERFGRVDVLCNNAGVSTFNLLRDQTLDDWRWVFSRQPLGCRPRRADLRPDHARPGHARPHRQHRFRSPGC